MKRSLALACSLALVVSCAGLAAGQEPSPAPPTPTAAQAPGFRALLLLVKADWSQSPTAKEIYSSLQRLLENESVPQELRDKLPASATQILFPPRTAAHYTAEHFEQLLAWLKSKELVVEEKLLPGPGEVEVVARGPEGNMTVIPGGFYVPAHSRARLITHVARPYDILGLPPIPNLHSSHPLIRRQAQLLWHVSQDARRLPAGPIYVELQLRISARSRDQADNDAPLELQNLERIGAEFSLDAGHVAVINGFQSPDQSTFLAAARRKGFEALIAIGPAALPLPDPPEPRLHLPDKVRTINVAQHETWGDFPGQGGQPADATGGAGFAGEPAAAEQPQLKVITLAHARAGDMAKVVSQVFLDVRVSVDERTNSVILSGSPVSLEIIRTLLTSLDATLEPGTAPPGGVAPQARQRLGASASGLAGEPAAAEATQLKVITLAHARAGDMAQLIAQMFGEVRVRPDERTNSLVLSGSEANLEIIRALLARLDAPLEPGNSPQGGAAAQARQLMGASAAALGDEYSATEQRAADFARKIRELPARDAGREKMAADLRHAVAESFAARRRQHQAELAGLEQRLAGIRQSIAARDRIQDQIIDRRVADLLNPALQWEADSRSRPPGKTVLSGAEPPTASAPPATDPLQARSGSEGSSGRSLAGGQDLEAARAYRDKLRERWQAIDQIYQQGRVPFEEMYRAAKELGEAEVAAAATREERRDALTRLVERVKEYKSFVDAKFQQGLEPLQNKLAAEAELLKAEAALAAEGTDAREPPASSPANPLSFRSPAGAAGQTTILRSAEEFDSALREAQQTLTRAQREPETRSGKPDYVQSREEMRLRSIAGAQRRLDFLREEYAAQIRLLELELQEAETAVTAAMRERGQLEELIKAGAVPRSRDFELRREHDVARLRLQRAKTLLDLYRKAGPEKPAEPPEPKEPGGAAAARDQVAANMRALITAVANYGDQNKRLPAAVMHSKDGKPTQPYSWRVAVLPFLPPSFTENQAIYDAYRFDEPWDSEHNRTLLAKMPAAFRSPLDKPESTNTSIFGIVWPAEVSARMSPGDGSDIAAIAAGAPVPKHSTIFSRPAGARMMEITDGTSNTIALVEAKRHIPWTKPEDIPFYPAPNQPLPELGGWFAAGWHAGFMDGKVEFLSTANDAETIRALFTIGGGEQAQPRLAPTP